MTKFGSWLDLASAQVAEIMAGTGFDFIVVDLEHGVAGIETAQHQLMAISGSDCMAIVRVPVGTEAWIKRVLDAGADGVMIPKVETAAQAKDLVSWCFYHPKGVRGDARAVVRASDWGRDVDGYKTRWNADGFLSVQIESVLGLQNIEEIAAVKGVSQLFFGPADYSVDAGVSMDSAQTLAAAKTVIDVANAHGLASGAVSFPNGTPSKLAELGMTHISVTGDVSALVSALSRDLLAAKGG